MAHDGHRDSGPHHPHQGFPAHSTGERALRGEVPSIVAVLAHEAHFALMRGYSTFTFDDHEAYLQQLEGLLRSLSGQGLHTRLALFDPAAYEQFCQEEDINPDTPGSRTRYTAEVAACGATVPYRGERVGRLLPLLLDAHACRLTWDVAAEALARAGLCAHCGADVAHEALERAGHALATLLGTLGDGTHHMVCSAGLPGGPLVTALDAVRPPGRTVRTDETRAMALSTVLAAGLATGSTGGIVLRSDAADITGGHDVVRGWCLHGNWLRPLTAAEVFTAYCTDATTGEPIPPEFGVDYAAGYELPHPGGDLHC